MRINKFPTYLQQDQKDCGPACLKIVGKFYEKSIPIGDLREYAQTNRLGSSLRGLSHAAEKIGFRTLSLKVNLKQLKEEVFLPCIIHWKDNHYTVLYKIKKGVFYVSDPGIGLIKYSEKEFLKGFTGQYSDTMKPGVILLLEKTPAFDVNEFEEEKDNTFRFLLSYARKYNKFFGQLFIGIIATSLLNLFFPFLTQAVVDVGIQNQDIDFIYLILMAQLMLFVGKTSLSVIKAWLVLHMTKRINISILADFFSKLMRLPIAFFDSKMIGDLFQRINDHTRIENFIANSSMDTVLSLVNLVVFSAVLGYYNTTILLVFICFSILYIIWIALFLKKRKILDYKQFSENASNQSKIIELLTGLQEIKLNNAELSKRWEWERIQAKLFKINIKNLSLEQTQAVGSQFINELKNIIISFYSAMLVIEGSITLGMMLSIAYMIGQLNIPLLQMLTVMKSYQDAKIGIARFREIQDLKDEDHDIRKSHYIDFTRNIVFKDVSFRYNKLVDKFLFKDLNLVIPANKTTAIVGLSGSGKTTLLKLFLKFYDIEKGEIIFGDTSLKNILASDVRQSCGVVMQEGIIFPNSVVHNITIGSDHVDEKQLKYALKIANIEEFITSLPKGVNTEIGKDGIGMSTGQKQRILIARAVYKNPKLLLFDEATSALDAMNEKVIMNNLYEFFEEKTVIIVAHRLSTVKNADNIIVLQDGKIVEQGNHKELTKKKGAYFELVKNQLELGN